MFQADELREILNSHRREIESLKAKSSPDEAQLALLKKQIELLEAQNKSLQEKYDLLLKHVLGSTEKPQAEPPKDLFHVDKLQLLILLDREKATSQELALTSIDLKEKFSIHSSDKTIRNKLNEAESAGLVASFGLKPKRYYLTVQGMQVLRREQKELLQVSFEPIR